MLIRLIGTVAIVTPDGPVEVTAPKLAGVLAALASRPGVAVSQHELIDRVWGSNPPDTVFNVVYSYIARLRTLLKPLPQVRIDRASGSSYTLNLPDDQVDISMVRSLITEASALTETGDRDEALARLRRASSLADAPALVGVSGQWAKTFRDGFHRERVGLLTERFRLELAMGNHATIVEELVSAVDSAPLAEPLVSHLMLAHYRCGSPAEALNRFETTRQALRKELGADPSDQLAKLHRQILNQDPQLDRAAPSASESRVPSQLPSDTVAFTGRKSELDELTRLAQSHGYTGLATVVGIGGVGKTALSVHWGHESREHFPGGQLYVNLRGFDNSDPVSPFEALERMLSALGITASLTGLDAAAELFRSATADSGTLLILDNAHDAAQVRPLLPGSGCFTIITSRNRLTGLSVRDGAHPIRLTALPNGQSAALLTRLLGDNDNAQIRRLADLCGNLPLALRIAAARVADDPVAGVAGYADRLQQDQLNLLSVADDPESAVTNNLDLSFHALDPDSRDLFCRIGSLPGEDVPTELIHHVSPLPSHDTDQAMTRLLTGHLLEQHRQGRYRMHDLVRLYSKQRAHSDLSAAEHDELVNQFIDWHHDRAYQRAGDEEDNIFAAAEALSEHPRLWRLLLPLRNPINEGRSLDRSRQAVEAGLRRSRAVGDARGVFRMTSLLATVCHMEGELPRAIQFGESAAKLAESLGHREQTIASGNLGIYRFGIGDMRGSAHNLATAIDVALRNGNLVSPRIFLSALVDVLTRLGEPDVAREQVARLTERLGEDLTHDDRMRTQSFMSRILVTEGRFEEALTAAERAVELANQQPDHYLTAQCLSELGEVLYRIGWTESAQSVLLTELSENQVHDRTAIEAEILCDHAAMLADLGEYERAMKILTTTQQKSTLQLGVTVNAELTLANIHNGLRQPEAALSSAQRAVDGFTAMQLPARHEEALWALADAHAQLGDIDAARECLVAADAISAPINNGRRPRMRKPLADHVG